LFSDILKSEVQAFILQHESDDPTKLILKSAEVCGVPMARIADQIEGRKRAKEKLPSYYNTKEIVFPTTVSIEQSSSESTAEFKSEMLSEKITQRSLCVDLTGGLGVDTFFFSRVFDHVDYVEPNTELLEIARHNHLKLGSRNISYHNLSSSVYLGSADTSIDCVYIDPSRRDAHNRKISSLASCEPNVLELLPSIFHHTKCVLLKTSPLLDITEAIKQLDRTSHVYVISVDNECKEVLFFMDYNSITEPLVEAINLSKGSVSSFRFVFSEEKNLRLSFADPEDYIYEPNASILKAGAFKTISTRFSINKIHPNTHLYSSNKLLRNFPGRIFKIVDLIKPEPKVLKQYFPKGYANIFTRNYPLSTQELKAKTRLKDGGSEFLIGFSGVKKKFLAVATKIV
jgi:hypothetical protein